MFNAQSTAMELGWDPGMRLNVPMAPLLNPRPKARGENLATGEQNVPKAKNASCTQRYRAVMGPLNNVYHGGRKTLRVFRGVHISRVPRPCLQFRIFVGRSYSYVHLIYLNI